MFSRSLSANIINKDLLKLLKQIRYNAFGFFFVGFVIPIIAGQRLGITGSSMSILFSLQTFGLVTSSFFSGKLADNKNHRGKLIFLGSIGRGIGYIIIFFAILFKQYPLMMMGTFSLGFFVGFFWNPLRAIIADSTPFENRSEAYGTLDRQQGIGAMVGSVCAFTVFSYASKHNFPDIVTYSPFIFFAIANIYAGIRVLILAPKVPLLATNSEENNLDSLAYCLDENLLTSSSVNEISNVDRLSMVSQFFTCLLFLLFMQSFVASLVAPFFQVYFMKNITNDIALLSIAYIPGTALAMILSPVMGRLADKFDAKIFLCCIGILGAMSTWLLIHSTSIWQISIIYLVSAVVNGTGGLVLIKILSELSLTKRGSVFGMQSLIANIGSIAGPIIGGLLWDKTGEKSPFLLSISLGLVLSVLYFFLFSTFKNYNRLGTLS